MQTNRPGDAVIGIEHVQVAIPQGGEEQARTFYADVLGLVELAKPPALAGRGGVWFACGAQQLHLGVDPAFTPQRKGHPALLVADLAATRARLSAAGTPIVEDELLPGYERIYTADPFGNRLELLRPTRPSPTREQEHASPFVANPRPAAPPLVREGVEREDTEAIKQRVRENFGRTAQAYVESAHHAHGSDLQTLLGWAAPKPTDHALDVSTGGGHTALALAPHVARITASDLTPRMLAAARRHLGAQGVTNADYVIADAEQLPFLDASFDLVTVRIAPHHYADARRAIGEMARVLVRGGRLVVIDNIASDDPQLDEYANRWERWRDPSHVRAYTLGEWSAFFESAGLRVERLEARHKTYAFAEWVERMQLPAAERAALEADMLGAPAAVRDFFALTARDGHVVSWSAEFMLALALKSGEPSGD